jgi:hypothetical protein
VLARCSFPGSQIGKRLLLWHKDTFISVVPTCLWYKGGMIVQVSNDKCCPYTLDLGKQVGSIGALVSRKHEPGVWGSVQRSVVLPANLNIEFWAPPATVRRLENLLRTSAEQVEALRQQIRHQLQEEADQDDGAQLAAAMTAKELAENQVEQISEQLQLVVAQKDGLQKDLEQMRLEHAKQLELLKAANAAEVELLKEGLEDVRQELIGLRETFSDEEDKGMPEVDQEEADNEEPAAVEAQQAAGHTDDIVPPPVAGQAGDTVVPAAAAGRKRNREQASLNCWMLDAPSFSKRRPALATAAVPTPKQTSSKAPAAPKAAAKKTSAPKAAAAPKTTTTAAKDAGVRRSSRRH